MKKRMLSLLLAMVMVLAMLPVGAMAAEEGPVIIQLPDEITGVGAPQCERKFSEGLLVVYTGEVTYDEEYGEEDYSNVRFGYVDKTGKVVIPMEYENVGAVFSGGLVSAKKDGKWGVIDTTGKVVIPFQADRYIGEFSGNAAPVQVKVGETYKWGLIDKTGKMVLPTEYDGVSTFDSQGQTARGLFEVYTRGENYQLSYGVVTDSGKILIPLEYDHINYDKYDGVDVFEVMKYDEEGNRSSRYYNAEGKEISKPGNNSNANAKTVKVVGYDAEYTGTFTNGLAAWSERGWGMFEHILIDETGKTVVPRGFKGATYVGSPRADDYSEEGLIALQMEVDGTDRWGNRLTEYGVADRAGNVVVPFGEYDFIENISDGGVTVAWTKKGDKTTFYIIDFSGMTLPLQNPTQTLVGLVEKPAVEPEPTTYTAKPTNDALKVDGKAQVPTAYKIGDSNYFQLRDVAMMLNGTPAQFSVDYDEARQAVVIVTGEAYTPKGWELGGAAQNSTEAILGNNDIYINGVKTDFAVYKIGGANFFQIRALGQALGFNVGWTAEQGMFIESDKPYVSP